MCTPLPARDRALPTARARPLVVTMLVTLLTAALLTPAGAHAQPPSATPATTTPTLDAPGSPPGPGLRLREALERAVAGNVDLLREGAAIELAAANLLAAAGAFDFVLTGDGTFARRQTPPINANDLAAGTTTTVTGNLALTRALETGGSLSLAAQEVFTRTNSRLNSCGMRCSFYDSNVTLRFTHPLLRGFGSEVTTANLRKQRILMDTELLNRRARAAVVLRDVVTAYWELGYAWDDLAIRRSAVRLAEEQRRYTQAQVDVGRLGVADLAAVDRAIADRQQDVAVAQQTLLGRGLDLQRLTGQPVAATFTSPAALERPSSLAATIDAATETTHALESSPQLRALRAGQTLSDIDVRTAQALVRPQLDFVGAVSTAGRQLAFDDAWAQAARFENLNWSAGLQFQLPVQNRVARGTVDAARASETQARLNVTDLDLSIRDGVVRLTGAIRTAARRGELARAAVGYAQKNLEAEKARFEVGRSTNNDVLLRQQELKAAEIQVARAAADQANAETALSALSGDILERHGITLSVPVPQRQ
jgi:outer membrane protein TolC